MKIDCKSIDNIPIIEVVENSTVGMKLIKNVIKLFDGNLLFNSSNVFKSTLKRDDFSGAHFIELKDENLLNDTFYLPFKENSVTAMELPSTGTVQTFITARMNGCSFYICRNLFTKKIVVCHANAINSSADDVKSVKDLVNKSPNWQSFNTQKSLARMMDIFSEKYKSKGNLQLLRSLYKDEYFKIVNHASNFYYLIKSIPSNDAVNFIGGTIVIGFRKNNKWSFYYQTIMNTNNINIKNYKLNYKIIESKKFFEEY
ncbi:hypothetical protein [Fluviispira sanaruensis]|uniref:Uncharacterized protein n=1 Tax=Fluviispira sanaruensis TaxID=2493639 RepID=A0A4P2VPH6_FLUSA|nr:hypothetical protein [Fluviispira sanaruensis]BBH53679.1 hypothetical protein JCM31447_21260 [Fluviispira sanaruensis]